MPLETRRLKKMRGPDWVRAVGNLGAQASSEREAVG